MKDKEEKSIPAARVIMFLMNPYTNDARVRREATTLVQAGFSVTIIARMEMDNGQVVPQHEWQQGVEVYRVSCSGTVTELLERAINQIQRWRTRAGPHTEQRLLTTSRLLRWFGITWRMALIAVRLNPDYYHAHDINTLPAAVLAKILRHRPLIYDSHEVATGRVGHNVWYMHALERAGLRFCDAIITTTETRASFMTKKYGVKPTVIGNMVDVSLADVPARDLYSELGIPEGQPIVIYQGGLQAGRGIEQVLASIHLWKSGIFVIVGGGNLLLPLKQLASSLGIDHRVRFVGRVPLEDLLGYTKAAAIGIQVLQNTCFNHFSTDSNKLFEYFAAGIPVVAADYPEIRKVVGRFNAGILIDPHDPHQIAEAVNQLLDPKVWVEKAEGARLAFRHYNWQTESPKLVELYRRLGK